MATGTSFKQQCPSCEAMVPVRDAGLIGRKIDCPKCKYRFVVEEPAVEEDDDDAPPRKSDGKNGITAKAGASKAGAKAAPAKRRGEDDDDDRPKKKPQGGGSNILILGGGLAAVAAVAVGVGIFAFMSSGETKPSSSGGGGQTSTGGTTPPATETVQVTPPVPAEAPAPVLFNITNLLPNDTQAVVAYPLSVTYGSALKAAGVEEAEGGFKGERFKQQMGFAPEDINRLITALNPKDNWVFTVLQTKKPYVKDILRANLKLSVAEAVKGKSSKAHEVFLVNADLDSMGNLFLKFNQPKDVFQVHFYDSNTIIFADPAPMKKFLEDDAKPELLTKDGQSAPAASAPGAGGVGGRGDGDGPALPGKGGPAPSGGMGMMGGPSMGGPGMGGPGMGGPGMGGPGMGGPGMGGPGGGQPAGDAAQVPNSWLTIDPTLKRLLDRVEKYEDNKSTRKKEPVSVVTVAEMKGTPAGPLTSAVEQYAKDEKSFVPAQVSKVGLAMIRKARAIATSLIAFDQKNATVAVALEYRDVREAEREERTLRPLMELLPPAIKAGLGLTVTVAQQQGNAGGFGFPGMSGPGMPGMGGGPMGPMGGMGNRGMMPSMPGPGGMGMGMRGGRGGPGGMVGEGVPGGGGGLSTGEGPAGFGGAPGAGAPEEKNDGALQLSQESQLIVFSMELQLTDEAYKTLFVPAQEAMQYLKSQAELSSSGNRAHELAKALTAYFDEKKEFPQGALHRPLSAERGLPWRPDQRLSWAAALLPYLGDDFREWKIDPEKGWNEDKNLLVAGRVVPALVSPRTPGIGPVTITYPGFHDKTFGATHFVGISGLGLDAAEYRADDATKAKKLGVFGYDRVTKRADVKDGFAKTIALIMVPGDHKTPWLAGGGATVRPVSEEGEDGNPVAPFVCCFFPAKPGGEKTKWDAKRGTVAIMCDGKVRFIPEDIPAAMFRGLCTIAGEESIDKLDTICPVIEEPGKREVKADVVNVPTGPAPAGAPAAGNAGGAPAGWKIYTPPSKAFSASFPGEVKEIKQELTDPATKMKATVSVYAFNPTGPGTGYAIAVQELPAGAAVNAEALYMATRDQLLATMGGKGTVKQEKAISQGANQGKEWTFEIAGVGTLRARAYMAGNRVFAVTAGPSPAIPEADVTKFLDSFKIGG